MIIACIIGMEHDNKFSKDTIAMCEATPLLRYWATQNP